RGIEQPEHPLAGANHGEAVAHGSRRPSDWELSDLLVEDEVGLADTSPSPRLDEADAVRHRQHHPRPVRGAEDMPGTVRRDLRPERPPGLRTPEAGHPPAGAGVGMNDETPAAGAEGNAMNDARLDQRRPGRPARRQVPEDDPVSGIAGG